MSTPGIMEGQRVSCSSTVERQHLDSSCARQPPKLGNGCTVQSRPVSEREAQHNHISCTKSSLFGGSLVSTGGPVPHRLTQLAKQDFQDNHADCTRLALPHAATGRSSIHNQGLRPKLGSSCSLPACGETDVLRADIDVCPPHARSPHSQQAVGSSGFHPHPQTWPLLTGSHVPKVGGCSGRASTGDNTFCRSMSSKGLSMPRLLLTPSSLRPMDIDRSMTRIPSEDGTSTAEPRSSIGSEAFSEFLEGDPWEGCEELVAQDLTEWYQDFLSGRPGQQGVADW